jgi:hypothetical protein
MREKRITVALPETNRELSAARAGHTSDNRQKQQNAKPTLRLRSRLRSRASVGQAGASGFPSAPDHRVGMVHYFRPSQKAAHKTPAKRDVHVHLCLRPKAPAVDVAVF